MFIAVDHCSGEFIGTHASSSASRWEALEPIRQGVSRHFGGVGPDTALGLILRHDHGSTTCRTTSKRDQMLRYRRLHRLSCATPRAMVWPNGLSGR